MNWESVRCFIAVAEQGSLSAAAQMLNLSVATLGRRIDTLEANLGLRLLSRKPSGAVLTPNGKAILKLAAPGGYHLDQIERAARAMQNSPVNMPVRISATETIITDVLAPSVSDFFWANPNIQIDLESSNDLADLNLGKADIAIRMARPTVESLIAKKLPSIALALYCSANYLAGRDANKIDLSAEKLIWFDRAYGDIPENIWVQERGLSGNVILRSSSTRGVLQAAKTGVGIAPLPRFVAERNGLTNVPSQPLPLRTPWLVFHRDTRDNVRMKKVRNWILEHIGTLQWS